MWVVTTQRRIFKNYDSQCSSLQSLSFEYRTEVCETDIWKFAGKLQFENLPLQKHTATSHVATVIFVRQQHRRREKAEGETRFAASFVSRFSLAATNSKLRDWSHPQVIFDKNNLRDRAQAYISDSIIKSKGAFCNWSVTLSIPTFAAVTAY